MNDRLSRLLWPCVAILLLAGACDRTAQSPPASVTAYTSLKLTLVGEGECWARAGAVLALEYVEDEYVVLRYATPPGLTGRDTFSPECRDGAAIVMTGDTYGILDQLYSRHLEREREKQALRDAARRLAERAPSSD